MDIKLITFSNDLCTIGKVFVDNEFICHTIEKPWLYNKPCVSCVPEGIYDLIPTLSPKFGQTYCLVNQELDVSLCGDTKRTHILWHKANKESQLLGCIAPVSSFGIMDGEWAGFNSKAAYDRLMEILNKEQHKIEIIRN